MTHPNNRHAGRLPGLVSAFIASFTLFTASAQGQSTVVVTTTAMTVDGDTSSVAALTATPGADGKISFAEALTAINATGPGNTIAFDLPHGSTIQTGTSILYAITAPGTTINGDADGDGLPDVAIYNAPNVAFYVPLKVITDHVAIRNLSTAGILLASEAAHDCEVTGCYLGVDVDGITRLPVYGDGMEIREGAHHNTVEGCIAAGNTGGSTGYLGTGIFLHKDAHDNSVQSCRVGVDINGNAQPNDLGLLVGTNTEASPHNVIGGIRTVATNPGNVISGNTYNGLELIGPGTTGNTVLGNVIGLDPTGTKAVPNGGSIGYTAFFVGRGAAGNTIGGIRLTGTGGDGNIISGNTGVGLGFRYDGTTGNTVTGNIIGTDLSGTVPIPNGGSGIVFSEGAKDNTVGTGKGGDVNALYGNLIAGNGGAGVKLSGTAAGNTIRGNEIRDNKSLGIDLSGNDRAKGDFVTANDADDSDTGPNDLMNFPVGVTAWYNPATNVTTVSGILARPNALTATIDIYGNRTVDPSGFGEGERYIGSTQPDLAGVFQFQVPGHLPAGYPFLSATATDIFGNTSEFSPVCGDPDGDGNPDSDGDGLCDDWETKGIDFDGDGVIDLDLPAMGANPRRKDVFVEIDYMEAPDHTHKPNLRPDKGPLPTDPLLLVANAFSNAPVANPDASTGITLHAMVDEAVPEAALIDFYEPGPGPLDSFDDYKTGDPDNPTDGYFGTAADRASPNAFNILGARRLAFRYCLFSHSVTEGPTVGGIAEIGGDDFTISMGGWVDWARAVAGAWSATGTITPTEDEFSAEWVDAVAGTFMHELGHTLGLHHGGGLGIPEASADNREIHRKPNYLSVMNYARQFSSAGDAVGLPGIPDGKLVRLLRPLDYSRAALPSLNENRLKETDGIAGPAGQRTLFGVYGERKIGPTNGPIDWNDSGVIDTDEQQLDLNYLIGSKKSEPSPGETLLGHDDWANLIYTFRASDEYGNSVRGSLAITDEMTSHDYLVECLGGPKDAKDALRIAGGLLRGDGPDMALLNQVVTGTSAGRVDLLDAVRRVRQAAGLDPNP